MDPENDFSGPGEPPGPSSAPSHDPSVRIWILSASLLATGALLYSLFVHGGEPRAPVHFPWWALVLGMLAAELTSVKVQLHKEGETFSLAELPMIFGLFFFSPSAVFWAQVIGLFVPALLRKQLAIKVVFNVAQIAVATVVAIILFRAITEGNPLHPESWLAAIVAAGAQSFLSGIFIGLVISFSEMGTIDLRTILWANGLGMLIAVANASLALPATAVAWIRPSLLWMFLTPTAVLFLAYKAYTKQRARRETLEALYSSAHSIQKDPHLEAILKVVLQTSTRLLKAEKAKVVIVTGDFVLEASIDGAGRIALTQAEHSSAALWEELTADSDSLIVPKPVRNDRLNKLGISDLMVVRLNLHDREGWMVVANRLGSMSSFERDDLAAFEAFAGHVALALDNADLLNELRDALEQARESSRTKNNFVAAISHELRTPLTSINGSAQTLLRTDIDIPADDMRRLIEVIERQGKRLQRLVENLLIVSVSDLERNVLQEAPLAVSTVIDQAINDAADLGSRHRFVVVNEPGLPNVTTDALKFKLILSNLVENAIKYSAAGTTITLKAESLDDGIRVAVEDQGEGIPEEEGEKIFERFYQIDQSSTRSAGGVGLGLHICRNLAAHLGMQVSLDRSDEHGSAFSIWIPIQRPERSHLTPFR